ncbi:MAG: Ribosomal RNA large subunit methyltransferase E [Methanomassiliicoccales archaeon PtaU1.Bin124]|nr:MAG: Ribosomal RNA large subunit methyltransferase E [Methanomassiliicoccales archaeon PtaU1.Bin124]
MSKTWLAARRHDHYYRLAKQLDYRSRASFKLIQIDDKFKLLKPGSLVVDLGAAPGGWLQVAAERVGGRGKVIGVDLQSIEPIEGTMVETIRGDIRKPETIEKLLYLANGKVDVVLSDMSPNISGSYSTDHARSVELCEHALNFAKKTLVEGGSIVMKIFEGDMMKEFMKEIKANFEEVKLYGPKASRSSSSEIYIIGKGFIPRGEEATTKESA